MVGYGARVAMWEQAQAAASRMQIRWSDRVGTAVRFKELGLLLYGIAVSATLENGADATLENEATGFVVF